MFLKLFIVLMLVFCAILNQVHGQTVCSECVCPAEYDPLCARQKVTNKLRGFSSMCVMNCTNLCQKNKYEFVKKGRCGTGSKRVTVSTGGEAKPTRPTKRPSLLFI